MPPAYLLAIYSILVVLASLLGGWLPTVWPWNHRWMQAVMSFVGGVMLGIAVLHLWPHSIQATHSVDQSAVSALVGLVAIFLLIRVFHVHQHPSYPEECSHHPHRADKPHWHDALDNPLPAIGGAGHQAAATSADVHGAAAAHHSAAAAGGHQLSWIGLFAGMAIHTALDGVALAASLAGHHEPTGVAGMGAFLAVFLHKPLDALSITVLMVAGGWSKRWQLAVNIAFAFVCPLAAWVFFVGADSVSTESFPLIGWALGFSAGVFLCISLADILPEIQFHAHDRLLLTFLLIAGILLAWALGFVEPYELHGH